MISSIKRILKASPVLYSLIKAVVNYWHPSKIDIQEVLSKYDAYQKEIFFVQIGSNDGQSGDPIYKFITSGGSVWKGILIEPIPYLFKKLKANYLACSDNLIFENVAIDKHAGTKTLYRIQESNSEETPWFEQIGSFSKEMVEKHKKHIENFENRLIEESVKTISLNELLLHHNISEIDLIHIDTEGYDYEIIKMIDWQKFCPSVLLFEHKHLSLRDYKNCCRFLRQKKFKLFMQEGDTLAIATNVAERLTES